MKAKQKTADIIIYIILTILAVVFLVPIFLVIMNSFKNKLYINTTPFQLPNADSFVAFKNYIDGLTKIKFWESIGYSLFITVASVAVIVVCCSMVAWYIVRVKNKITAGIYYAFIASMVVPFQMVMYTMTKVANMTHLDNYVGILLLYLGFGAPMAVFMFTGNVKSLPMELEEAALIDGCTPLSMFFKVIFPVMKPILITVAILDAMWIWNDFQLPYLIIGTKYRTVPVAIQYLKSGYGSMDYGHLMAVIVVALIPIVIFYFACQKYIIEGIVDGAVKG